MPRTILPSSRRSGATLFAGLAGFAVGHALSSPQVRFARMAGFPIAAPTAVGWVTDFINAGYYRRAPDSREVDDLRLTRCILTSYGQRGGGRRLRGHDVLDFHRAFGRQRLDARRSARGTLSREELLEGAAALLGDWFPDAYADPERRAYGIAFETTADRDAYSPEDRLGLVPLGGLTPESAPPERQVWHTYPAVELPSADAALTLIHRPERWPDFGSELGRFMPLRKTGLLGQTFEIEVVAGTSAGRPIFTRGYVSVTRVVDHSAPGELARYVAVLNENLARYGQEEPPAVPDGAEPLIAFDLTTHEGHFMGRGHNRLIVYERDARPYIRAAGTWDPMPWHLEYAYRVAGRQAQHAFWGHGAREEQSMLCQLAKSTLTAPAT
jgi:hypothetical protein